MPLVSSRPALHRWLETRISAATGFEIRLGHLRLGYDLAVDAEAISVAGVDSLPFLKAKQLRATPSWASLARGAVATIRIVGADLYLQHLPLPASPTPSNENPPKTNPLRTRLLGQHIMLVDSFVHFETQSGKPIGPLTLGLDSVAGGESLQLNGAVTLAGGSEARWSAELGTSIGTSRARIQADAAFDELLRSYNDGVPPAALQGVAGALVLDLQGTQAGRLAFNLDATIRLPGAAKAVPVSGSGEIDPAAQWLSAKLRAQEFGVQSDDSARVASGVEVRADLTVQRRDGGTEHVDFAVDIPRGELLWESYYVDLALHPFKLSGRLEPDAKKVQVRRAAFSAGGIGSLRGSGSCDVAQHDCQWQLDFDIPGLRTLYRLAVRDPLAEARPTLAGSEVEGRAIGTLTRSVDAGGVGQLRGTLDLAGAAFRLAQPPLQISGVDLHLPIDFSDDDRMPVAPQGGWLHLERFVFEKIDLGRIELPLDVATNRIGIAEVVRIPLFGGIVDVTALRGEALHRSSRRLTLGLSLQDIDLEPLTQAVGLPRIAGKVSGAMPSLALADNRIESEGEITIEAFDGSVRLHELRVDDLLSPVPSLRLDLTFRDLSLKQLTRTFAVGQISGILGGKFDDLVLVDGQPVSFEARVATEKRAGVSQRISVRAIRQISILGGSGGDPLSQGILQLFDEYRYAKMGFHCRLENDRFVLRGVEEIGGKEYLVVGATLPPRVSVVSHTSVIAFSELVRRLTRLAAVEDEQPPSPSPGEGEQQPGSGDS